MEVRQPFGAFDRSELPCRRSRMKAGGVWIIDEATAAVGYDDGDVFWLQDRADLLSVVVDEG